MKIGITNDHRGYKLKTKLVPYLLKKGYEVEDYGTSSTERVDYPDYGIQLGEKVRDKEVDFGIAICGTGVGVSIACNKVRGVRCAKVNNVREARLSRSDDDANIIALNQNMYAFEAKDIIDVFLNTELKKIDRYQRRIDKITKYEEQSYER